MNRETLWPEEWDPQPKRKHDNPRERRVTLCIAAIATEKDADRLIMCMDRMISTDIVSAEVAFKAQYIAPNWMALLAGTVSDAYELLDIYKESLATDPPSRGGGKGWKSLRTPSLILKQRRVEEYVQSRLGIPYDRFLKRGKEELDPDVRRNMLSSIAKIGVEADLAIGGFVDGKNAKVFRLIGTNLREEASFACIGSGAAAAEHFLYFRGQEAATSVEQSLYNLWEAKKFGELVPGVGRGTDMMILEPGFHRQPDGRIRMVSEEGKAFLDRQFKRYGPRRISGDIKCPENMYRPLWRGKE